MTDIMTAQSPAKWGRARDGRFGSKVGQIGPKWDKSGAFLDQISVHLARGANLAQLNAIPDTPGPQQGCHFGHKI